jgi:hypothetical protein
MFDAFKDAFDPKKHPHAGKGASGGKGGQFVKGGGGGGSEAPHGEKQAKGKSSPAPEEPEPKEERGSGSEHMARLTPTEQRAWSGRQQSGQSLGKQAAGALGEEVALEYIRTHLKLKDAQPLNMEAANFPVDLIGDHQLFEIKTGQVTNGPTAQQWRATIGQPGKQETEWLKTASTEEKAAHNQAKRDKIMQRKEAVLADYEKKLGQPVKAQTVTLIINAETGTADIFVFDGFHHRIGYNSPEAKQGYVGSFAYGKPSTGDSPGRVRPRTRRMGGLLPLRAGRVLFWLHHH